MTLVFSHLSASVDGYVSGRGARAGLGLGDGFRIFDWLSDDSAPNRAVTEYDRIRTGAVVSGRNTYEHADRWGGGSMQAGAPLFVVSRDPIPDARPGHRHRRVGVGHHAGDRRCLPVRQGRQACCRGDDHRSVAAGPG